jgi:very-short-patch-repair endonuclease
VRKVFIEDLPKYRGGISWKESIGKEILFIYDDVKGKIRIIDYESNYVTILYNSIKFTLIASDLKKCHLGIVLGKIHKNYKYNIGDNVGKIKIIEQIRMKNGSKTTQKGYKYLCSICGNIDSIAESKLISGIRCNVCCEPSQKVLIGYNDIATTAPWMIDLLVDKNDRYKYTCKSSQYIWFKCPNCQEKRFLKISKVYQYGIGCKKCNDGISYPNKFMYNILCQLNIVFKTEYNPHWIKPKRYDFYIPSQKLIIEMDGSQHSKDKSLSSNWISLEEQNKIDRFKDSKAKEHGIKVIRINCFKSEYEYIKNNILESELKNILDLSQINWIDCHTYSMLNSQIIEACNLWNNGIHSTREIGVKLNISSSAICRYLKHGAISNLCDYDAKLASIQSQMRNTKRLVDLCSLKVVCLNNGIIYDSAVDASNKLNISSSHISSCCTGKRLSCGMLNNEKLVWRHYSDYQDMSNTEIINIINKVNDTSNGTPRKIFCIELNQIFDSARDANRKIGVSFMSICSALNGRSKSAGRHPFTNEKLHWIYYEDGTNYQNSNKAS